MGNNIFSDSKIELQAARKQASDYAMAMDSLAKITRSENEKETIESILQLFEMLFFPRLLSYISLTNGVTDQVYSISKPAENETDIKNRIVMFPGKYVWTESQKGFQIKIRFGGNDFGILEIDNLKFPEHKEHYLNLTLSIAAVCGLAIENARRHQAIKAAQKKLIEEKEKLEAALSEVKKLSGLVPICSYCKKIRDDKGYWNRLEKYIEENSDAQFSHSICDDCLEEKFPEEDDDD